MSPLMTWLAVHAPGLLYTAAALGFVDLVVRDAFRPDPLRALDGLATTYTHEHKDAA